MDLNQKLFVERMVAFRKVKGISQARLAELCDVSNGTIGNIECYVTKPSFDLIFKISEALTVQVKDLFDFTTPLPEQNDDFSEPQKKIVKELVQNAVKDVLENVNKNLEESFKKYSIEHPKKDEN